MGIVRKCFVSFQLWILPSLVGGSVLYFLSVDQWHRVAAWLYGSGLTGLFVTSTLFHTAAWKISHLRCVCVGVAENAGRDLADVHVCVFMCCSGGQFVNYDAAGGSETKQQMWRGNEDISHHL